MSRGRLWVGVAVVAVVCVVLVAGANVAPYAGGPGGLAVAVEGRRDAVPGVRAAEESVGVSEEEGFYDGWTNEEIAGDLVSGLRVTDEVVGEPTVVRYADIWEEDAELLGVPAEAVAIGGSPDLAIVMEGSFPLPDVGDSVETVPYALFVVDKQSGVAWISMLNNSREPLEDLLPEP
jgi:hypothetical protein